MSKRDYKSPEEIEREIRSTEVDIARALDLIQEKVSPGAVIDAVVRASRENGAEFASNFGRSVRDNPMPIALIGAGIAWLVISQRSDDRDRHGVIEYAPRSRPIENLSPEREGSSRPYGPGVYPTTTESGQETATLRDRAREAARTAATRAEQAASSARSSMEQTMSDVREGAMSAASGAATAARQAEDRAREAAHAAQERAQSLGEHAGTRAQDAGSAASEAYSSARSTAEEGVSSIRSKADEAMAGAQSAADRAYSGARSAGEQAYSSARAAGEHAAERLQAGGEAVYRRGSEVAQRTASRASETVSAIGTSLREHPLIAGAVFAGIGALVGALLPSTRREDALMGERSDSVKAKAVDTVEHQAERARDVAAAAAEGARREAEARGFTPEQAKEAVKDEIRQVIDSGREVVRTAIREGEAAAKEETGRDQEKSREEKSRQNEREKKAGSDLGTDDEIRDTGTIGDIDAPRLEPRTGAPVMSEPAVPPVPLTDVPGVTPPAPDTPSRNQDR
jgi:ElaB/YqjD/DUF883 family membrane-anchored ribosome-binding protein